MVWRIKGRQSRDGVGRFSSGGGGFAKAQGAQTPGGLRGIVARSRLRGSIKKLKLARERLRAVRFEQRGQKGFRENLAKAKQFVQRKQRHVALHRREVQRIEKRGLQRVGQLGKVRERMEFAKAIGASKGERIGFRQDRIFHAREKLAALRTKIREARATEAKRATELRKHFPGDKSIDGKLSPFARRKLGKALAGARKALRNRKRELARLG